MCEGVRVCTDVDIVDVVQDSRPELLVGCVGCVEGTSNLGFDVLDGGGASTGLDSDTFADAMGFVCHLAEQRRVLVHPLVAFTLD